jgi:hypothetical protein
VHIASIPGSMFSSLTADHYDLKTAAHEGMSATSGRKHMATYGSRSTDPIAERAFTSEAGAIAAFASIDMMSSDHRRGHVRPFVYGHLTAEACLVLKGHVYHQHVVR